MFEVKVSHIVRIGRFYGNLEESVEEKKIEFVCPRNKTKSIIQAIKKSHPYEEVALDIYPLIGEEELR